ncbi:hypothetical protein C6A86_023490 [Mycobacterium sp. ITM-2016-00316]|uniref:hypothetical protein n=1 Tax=Mycobacterium sp. ITM-2016-00316 TaxID=2099695 RepID=UPI000CF965D2|nr:hypothetical protein [Mycobacterium sp. ITM-2016-00316]WNG81125.1 hypothetical protein C6A86_023490 [Mycobacterium sp. ITM-2016-00316]
MNETDVLMFSAVKYPSGEIVTGRRHRYVYKQMADRGIISRAGCIEGFVGKGGVFYTRQEAIPVAIAARQLAGDHCGELTSEALWPLTAAEKSRWDER